jgi:hypothetical protein
MYVPDGAFSWIRLPIVDKINLHKMDQRLTEDSCRKIAAVDCTRAASRMAEQTTGAGSLRLLLPTSAPPRMKTAMVQQGQQEPDPRTSPDQKDSWR